MAAINKQPGTHWRDVAIAYSEVISDAWQVALAWLGRFAEIILFTCMFINLVEIVVHLPDWFVGFILVVQMVTLDVAGFGLNEMAAHVKRSGDVEAGKDAEKISHGLIAIMIVTLLSVTIDHLFGTRNATVHLYIGYFDDVLILVRVVAVVLYGHTIRKLRSVSQQIALDKNDETEQLRLQIADLQQKYHDEKQKSADILRLQNTTVSSAETSANLVNDLQSQLQNLQTAYAEQTAKMQTVTEKSADAQSAISELRRLQSAYTTLQSDLHTTTAKLHAAEMQINKLQTASLPAVKPANVTSIDQARGKGKVSADEILAFKSAHPEMKNADVAGRLGISERKLYDALKLQSAEQSAVSQ